MRSRYETDCNRAYESECDFKRTSEDQSPGRLRGGLALGVVVVCVFFAAMTGVTATATLTMGLIAIPAMLKRGYDRNIAIGTVAGAGTLGILIPPSIISILLALVGNISVGKVFMAGVIPGIIIALIYIIYIVVRAWLNPRLCPSHPESFTLKQKIISSKAIILPSLIIVSVLGSIFFGIATPTEASALGVVGVLASVLIHRRFSWKLIIDTTVETFRITGLTMWIFFGAMLFSAVYARAGGAAFLTTLIMGMGENPWAILIFIMMIAFVLGMFLDPLAIIIILCPVSFSLMKQLGFDLTWFSILFVINMQIGYMSPPFGYQLFYLKSVAPDGVTTADIYRAVPIPIAIMIGYHGFVHDISQVGFVSIYFSFYQPIFCKYNGHMVYRLYRRMCFDFGNSFQLAILHLLCRGFLGQSWAPGAGSTSARSTRAVRGSTNCGIVPTARSADGSWPSRTPPAGRGEFTGLHQPPRHHAVDRRPQLGEAAARGRLSRARPRRLQRGARRLQVRVRLVERRLAEEVLRHQAAGALVIELRLRQRRLGLRHLRTGAGHLRIGLAGGRSAPAAGRA